MSQHRLPVDCRNGFTKQVGLRKVAVIGTKICVLDSLANYGNAASHRPATNINANHMQRCAAKGVESWNYHQEHRDCIAFSHARVSSGDSSDPHLYLIHLMH